MANMGWLAIILNRLKNAGIWRYPQEDDVVQIVPAISNAAEAVNEHTARESRPLHDVRSYVLACGTILANDADIGALMQTFGTVSKTDLDWKNSPSYPLPYIAELKDVTVIPGSRILLNAEGDALSDEIELGFRMFRLRPKLWDIEITEGPNLNFERISNKLNLIQCGIHITGEHEANYFHWIVEVLPRLFLCEKLVVDKQYPILVAEGLHDNLYALLDCIRAPERTVLRLHRGSLYPVGRLIYPSDLTRIFDTYDRAPGEDTTYLPVALLREMGWAIKTALNVTKSSCCKSVFIKRDSNYRRLLNEPEIERRLSEIGFEAVDPAKLTLEEQIDAFSHAETIVGPSGAGMVNMLWCCPGTRIIILHSDHPFKKYPYWDALARASEVRVTYLAGPRAHNVTDMFEAHDDFSIKFENLLDALATR